MYESYCDVKQCVSRNSNDSTGFFCSRNGFLVLFTFISQIMVQFHFIVNKTERVQEPLIIEEDTALKLIDPMMQVKFGLGETGHNQP